ncbi:MAG TPA: GNAT family N-acetyltransferase [Verrucomicrobiae bacterium]|jgi:GNAT superfamily N-acetyltransferase|nr:GNAT family N-acetyltransferase [Verrucomicrobiae bacterium]
MDSPTRVSVRQRGRLKPGLHTSEGSGAARQSSPILTMCIKRSNPENALLLTEITFASKRHWRYPEHWIEEWRGLLTVEPSFISSHEVWEAVVDGTTAGYYALSPRSDGVELLHFWVRPEFIGRGIGRALFVHAVNKARELSARAIYIESDPNAEGFYLRMGANRIGVVSSKVAGQARELPLLKFNLTPRGAR